MIHFLTLTTKDLRSKIRGMEMEAMNMSAIVQFTSEAFENVLQQNHDTES